MKIKHLFIGIALTANLFAATAQEVKKTYFVSKPGTLISMMTEEEANQVTHLTLTGKINAVDFRHLRDEFKNLQVLDIANASISMYSGKEGTYPDTVSYTHLFTRAVGQLPFVLTYPLVSASLCLNGSIYLLIWKPTSKFVSV